MKFIFTILIYGFIQLLPVNFANPLPSISAKENLLDFYENELDIIAEDFCQNVKNLSEKLLQTKDIKEPSTNEIKEIKIFLQDFLQDYIHYERFKVYQPLFVITINILKTDNSKEISETDLKFKQTLKQYFANILTDYEQNYKKFINETFLPKIEDFKKQLSPYDLQQMPKLNEYLDKLKSCQNYQCFPINSDSLLEAINGKTDLIMKTMKLDVRKVLTLLQINLYKMIKLILKDENLSKLGLATRQNLTLEINDYCTTFESSNDVENFGTIASEKYTFPKQYINNTDMPLDDSVLFKEIVDKYNSDANKTKYDLENKNVGQSYIYKLFLLAFSAPEVIKLTQNFKIF